MTVCMYRDIHTLQPYIIDFTQRGCHTLRLHADMLRTVKGLESPFQYRVPNTYSTLLS